MSSYGQRPDGPEGPRPVGPPLPPGPRAEVDTFKFDTTDNPMLRYRVQQFDDEPWPTAEQIGAAAEARPFDRRWSCFRVDDCTHPIGALAEVAGWSIEVCPLCGHTSNVHCLHEAGFEWNEAGTLLRCRTCGVDGT